MKKKNAIISILVLIFALLTFTACSDNSEVASSFVPNGPQSSQEISQESETGNDATSPPEISVASRPPQSASNTPSGIRPSSGENDTIAEPLPEHYQLLMDEKADLVEVVHERVEAYRNGTPPEPPNHHKPYPSDFPPVSELPDIKTESDFAIRFTGNADALEGIYVAVPIDGEHEMHMTISRIMDENNTLSWGSGDTWFEKVSDITWESQDIDLYSHPPLIVGQLPEIYLQSPLPLSHNTITLADGKECAINIEMTNGSYSYAHDGGGTYGNNFSGSYQVRVYQVDAAGNQTELYAAPISVEGDAMTFGAEESFGEFLLIFDDYNHDGNPDFTLGQWGGSNGNIYKLFSVYTDGTVAELDTAGAMSISNFDFSIPLDKISNTSFAKVWYDNSKGESVKTVYEWKDERFAVVSDEPV